MLGLKVDDFNPSPTFDESNRITVDVFVHEA